MNATTDFPEDEADISALRGSASPARGRPSPALIGHASARRPAARRRGLAWLSVLVWMPWAWPVAVAAAASAPADVEPSLADLLQTQISTASRRAEPLREVSAAAFVLTAEDLRRSGAQSLPDALRLVPGVEVAQVGTGTFAISIRGSNDRYANKLLVLVDGRSVYSPLTAGVSWELLDIPLPDIDRIEVVRGPGTALWGSNAVNGTINILTRNGAAGAGSRVGLLVGGGGSGGDTLLQARHGWSAGEGVDMRVWAQARGARDVRYPMPDDPGRWRTLGAGLRIDQSAAQVQRMLSLSIHQSVIDSPDREQSLQPPYLGIVDRRRRASGLSLQFDEQRTLDANHALGVLASLTHEQIPVAEAHSRTLVADLDLQHRWAWRPDQSLIWGVSVRQARDSSPDSANLTYLDRQPLTRSGLYARNDWTLAEAGLHLSAAIRLEHQAKEPTQVEPTLRALWSPAEGQTLWAAWSKAARLPVRTERSLLITLDVQPPAGSGPPGPVQTLFDPRLAPVPQGSEHLMALEFGWRGELGPTLFADLALYRHRLSDLRNIRPAGPTRVGTNPPRTVIDVYTDNAGRATLDGLEAFADWRPQPQWRLQAGLTLTRLKPSAAETGRNQPGMQVFGRLSTDFAGGRQFDLTLRRVGRLRGSDVPAYTTADLRLGMPVAPRVLLELLGRNLLQPRHAEFPSTLPGSAPQQVERRWALNLSFDF